MCPELGVQWLVSNSWCPVLGVQWLVSNSWCPVLGVQCLVSSAWCPNCPVCPVLGVQWLVSNGWCPVLGVQTVQCVQCLLSNGLSPMVGDQWLVSNGWCPNCRTFFAVSCLALITASSIYGLTVPNRNWTLGQIKCQGSPLLYGFLIPLAQQKAAPYFGSQGYH